MLNASLIAKLELIVSQDALETIQIAMNIVLVIISAMKER